MATLAVDTVIGFIKEKLPPEFAGQSIHCLPGLLVPWDTYKAVTETAQDL
jgi:hypothetical protein